VGANSRLVSLRFETDSGLPTLLDDEP